MQTVYLFEEQGIFLGVILPNMEQGRVSPPLHLQISIFKMWLKDFNLLAFKK